MRLTELDLLKITISGMKIIYNSSNLYSAGFKDFRDVPLGFPIWLRKTIGANSLTLFFYQNNGKLSKLRAFGESYHWEAGCLSTSLTGKWNDKRKLIGKISIPNHNKKETVDHIGYYAIFRKEQFSFYERKCINDLFKFFGDIALLRARKSFNTKYNDRIQVISELSASDNKNGSILSKSIAKIHRLFACSHSIYFSYQNKTLISEYHKAPHHQGQGIKVSKTSSFALSKQINEIIKEKKLFKDTKKIFLELLEHHFEEKSIISDNYWVLIYPIREGGRIIALLLMVFNNFIWFPPELLLNCLDRFISIIKEHTILKFQKRSTLMFVNPIFSARDTLINKDEVFVIMPFTEPWSERIWKKIIQPIVEIMELKSIRGDDLYGRDIMEDIWTSILRSNIIIADITGRNPNVFYELGIAHCIGKNVILLTQNVDDIPFDLNRYRHIIYEDNYDGYEKLNRELSLTIKELL